MHTRPAEQRAQNARAQAGAPRRRVQPRMPSTVGYMAVAGGLALALFGVIWFLLRTTDGDEAPWFPSGLAAGSVILIAAAAREVVMRRAWARYAREMEMLMGTRGEAASSGIKP